MNAEFLGGGGDTCTGGEGIFPMDVVIGKQKRRRGNARSKTPHAFTQGDAGRGGEGRGIVTNHLWGEI